MGVGEAQDVGVARLQVDGAVRAVEAEGEGLVGVNVGDSAAGAVLDTGLIGDAVFGG
jgi:hypothetical protein